MTRYIVQFVDKTTKRVSEKEANAMMACLDKGKPCVLRGAFFQPHFISAIKPISNDWFGVEYVEKQLLSSKKDDDLQLL